MADKQILEVVNSQGRFTFRDDEVDSKPTEVEDRIERIVALSLDLHQRIDRMHDLLQEVEPDNIPLEVLQDFSRWYSTPFQVNLVQQNEDYHHIYQVQEASQLLLEFEIDYDGSSYPAEPNLIYKIRESSLDVGEVAPLLERVETYYSDQVGEIAKIDSSLRQAWHKQEEASRPEELAAADDIVGRQLEAYERTFARKSDVIRQLLPAVIDIANTSIQHNDSSLKGPFDVSLDKDYSGGPLYEVTQDERVLFSAVIQNGRVSSILEFDFSTQEEVDSISTDLVAQKQENARSLVREASEIEL